jgi:hypothetical protein
MLKPGLHICTSYVSYVFCNGIIDWCYDHIRWCISLKYGYGQLMGSKKRHVIYINWMGLWGQHVVWRWVTGIISVVLVTTVEKLFESHCRKDYWTSVRTVKSTAVFVMGLSKPLEKTERSSWDKARSDGMVTTYLIGAVHTGLVCWLVERWLFIRLRFLRRL